MRVGFLSLSLIISVFGAALAGFAEAPFAMQITFVQAPQSRGQTQPQQGLPPDKKKSLSKYGPEDVFPEQEESRGRDSRRGGQPTPTPRSSPSPSPSLKPSVTPSATPSATSSQSKTPIPSPTVLTASFDNQSPQQPLDQQSSSDKSVSNSKWVLAVLIALALVVSVALIYVIGKLKETLREGRG